MPGVDTDGLWATYHHIKKLDELGCDERGNTWDQDTWGDRGDVYSREQWVPSGDEYYILPEGLMELAVPDQLCETAMCFAGWYCAYRGLLMDGAGTVVVGGERRHVAEATTELAGLQGHLPELELYDFANTLEMLADWLTYYTGEDRR